MPTIQSVEARLFAVPLAEVLSDAKHGDHTAEHGKHTAEHGNHTGTTLRPGTTVTLFGSSTTPSSGREDWLSDTP